MGGPPSRRIAMPPPVLYSLTARLHGELTASAWSVLGPAAFFTMPAPTCALPHFAGTVASSRSPNEHFGKSLGLVLSPSDPIAYFSTTVARLLGSVSLTWKLSFTPVGMGFVFEPLPLTDVDPETVYTFAATATPATATTAASASTAIE